MLFSPINQFQKSYQLANELYPLKVEQVVGNCNLIILVDSQDGQKLIRMNQAGEIEQEIFSFENIQAGTQSYMPSLSKTGKYIAYVVFSGELYYDSAQYQDIEVIKIEDKQHPIRITSHGGAWKEGGVWSPDGMEIAYTDYDDHGILQVYITKIADEISTMEITQFKDLGIKAGPISWSPSGDQLAVILEDNEQKTSVWIVSTQSHSALKLDLPDGKYPIADKLYWSEDSSRLLLNIGNYIEKDDLAGLYWFDIENNKLLHGLTPKSASKINPEIDSFAYAFPLSTNLSRAIFYNSKGMWYLYDSVHQNIEYVSWLSNHEWGSHMDISLFSNDFSTCKPE
jgi:hypothetical protein